MARQVKFTKQELIGALRDADGDLTRAAVALSVAPSTVYRSMRRYGVQVEATRRVVTAAAS